MVVVHHHENVCIFWGFSNHLPIMKIGVKDFVCDSITPKLYFYFWLAPDGIIWSSPNSNFGKALTFFKLILIFL